jgi:hypothetical protein
MWIKNKKKERTKTYEEKVSFNGTFGDMSAISTTGAGAKKNKEANRKY